MIGTVLLVGCGNMGFALLSGWLKGALRQAQVSVVEPVAALRERASALSVESYAEAADLPGDFEPRLIVLAVKPQVMFDVLPPYKRFSGGQTTFLSIAAGVGSRALEAALNERTPIIRCMPNTPASIGHGAIVCYSNHHVHSDDASFAKRILSASGHVSFIDDEGHMDAVTAVSGSGPAYVFHFIECLAAAAREVGLPEKLAQDLALQTVHGAARLAAESSDEPAELRRQVTSPGGTTAAALEILMADGRLEDLMREAVAAATKRSKELGR